MTAAEYASHRGVSDSYVRRMRRHGKLVTTADGRRIVVADSDAMLDDITDPVRGGDRTAARQQPAEGATYRVPPSDVPSVQEAVRRERLAKAQLAELELGELTRALTRVRDVELTTFTLVREALNALMGIPGRIRSRLAAESSPQECEAIVEKEIRQVAEKLQRSAARLAARRAGAEEGGDADDAAALVDDGEVEEGVDDEP